MPAVWHSLKESMKCKSEFSLDVHDPSASGSCLSRCEAAKSCICRCRSGCSRSKLNLKDIVHGSKRHTEKQTTGSPKSMGSTDIHNHITHEVVPNDSKCELRITGFAENCWDKSGSTFMGTLTPGTPGPGDRHMDFCCSNRDIATPLSRSNLGGGPSGSGSGNDITSSKLSRSIDAECLLCLCHKCGENFTQLEAAEAHHLSKHAVTELVEGDSSRKIVELICQSGWINSEGNYERIEKVLKVHNTHRTLARFEEYRHMVKTKASTLPKKHPRCLADGNELLRFYGATVACSLGMDSALSLCSLEKCQVCQVLRHGFSTKTEPNGVMGVFTSSTSGRAFESIEVDEENQSLRKALIVCRVIAGRVHKPLDDVQEMVDPSSFDSVAGNIGAKSNIEELYLLNARALLPCFVVICRSLEEKDLVCVDKTEGLQHHLGLKFKP